MSQVTHPVHLFLGFWGIRSLGQTALSMVSTSTVNIWFVRLRGKATAITSLAAPVSEIALPPLIYLLIVNNGWRSTWVMLGIAIWVVLLPPAILLVRRTPESVGLKPDMGRKDVLQLSNSQSSEKEDSWTAKQAMKTKAFWLLIFAGTAGSLIGTAMTASAFFTKDQIPNLKQADARNENNLALRFFKDIFAVLKLEMS